MFFAPTLLHLIRKRITVHILCLSTGNYYGLGEVRRVELLNSCLKLHILPNQVHQSTKFCDDPQIEWDIGEVTKEVDRFVKLVTAKAVFTFDEGGISGHLNHISAALGSRQIKAGVPVYHLNSVSTFRKYIQIFDIIFSFFNEYLVLSNWRSFSSAWTAMQCHKSQLFWFRRLYIIFSRYMFINTWTRVK